MKYLILLYISILFISSCSKNDPPYNFSYKDVDGQRFSNSLGSVEFISEDSLLWETSTYRETPQSYMVRYQTTGNTINFAIHDTITTEYIDPITDREGFIKKYISGSFEGTFTSADAISAQEQHSYRDMVNDLYLTASGGASFSIVYSR